MFDDQYVYITLNGILNRRRIDRLARRNRRMRLIVMLAGTGILKPIFIEQAIGVAMGKKDINDWFENRRISTASLQTSLTQRTGQHWRSHWQSPESRDDVEILDETAPSLSGDS